MIFLQGSPILEEKGGIKLGRLSGISAHYVPNYLQKNRLPSWETNCIEDWETKVDRIIEETENENMTVIAGSLLGSRCILKNSMPKLARKWATCSKNSNYLFMEGSTMNLIEPNLKSDWQKSGDSIELFPASEGFFAYQDSQKEKGMLLLLDSGIFYEFVRADEFFAENPKRLTIADVEMDVDYVMILSTNAGLWAYNLGDTVRFVSKKPYRVIGSGRIKHFISAFGEHVIAKEVEEALELL